MYGKRHPDLAGQRLTQQIAGGAVTHAFFFSLGDLKLSVVAREFGEEVARNAKVGFIGTLGNLALNSGPDATVTPVYLITSRVHPKLLKSKLKGDEEGVEAILVSGDDLELGIPNRYSDAITLAAYTLYKTWRSQLP